MCQSYSVLHQCRSFLDTVYGLQSALKLIEIAIVCVNLLSITVTSYETVHKMFFV